jgi:RNA polymerase sigma-70 factor (ECF subfamily)
LVAPARAKAPWLRLVPGAAPAAPAVSDRELVEAVAKGDAKVAAELYDRLAPTVDRTIYRIFGRREVDHEDLVQSAFEHIVATLAKERFAGACSLTTWASTLATHVGLNALRARRRERKVLDRSEPADATPITSRATTGDAERALGSRFELERLRRALVAMDPAKAETVFLHDALGHELAEIAVMMNVSVAAAQSRLVRGRKELAQRLEQGSEDA